MLAMIILASLTSKMNSVKKELQMQDEKSEIPLYVLKYSRNANRYYSSSSSITSTIAH